MLKVLRDGLKDCVMRIRRFFIKKNVIGVLIESLILKPEQIIVRYFHLNSFCVTHFIYKVKCKTIQNFFASG